MRLRRGSAEQASALLMSLVLAGMLGAALGSYLVMVRSHYVAGSNSHSWNTALQLAEAGAEEALAQLNPGAGSPGMDPAANQWGPPVDGFYGPGPRELSGGSYNVVFTSGSPPVIYSTGSVHVPSIPATFSRVIRVTTTNVPLFSAAVAVRTNLTMTDPMVAGVFADSFDSSDWHHSEQGGYPFVQTNRAKANGDVAVLSGTLNLGHSAIRGDLLLGPTVNMPGTNPAAGVFTDFNADFPDLVLPTPHWSPPRFSNRIVDGVNYTYAFMNSGDFSLSTSGGIYVGTNAHVRVQITSPNFVADALRVAGSGMPGRLTIYLVGTKFTLGSDAIVENGNPASLSLFGTGANTRIVFATNSIFTGTIYAPWSDFTLTTLTHAHFVGSSLTRSLQINGSVSFHFDENLLRGNGPTRGVLAASWQELRLGDNFALQKPHPSQ